MSAIERFRIDGRVAIVTGSTRGLGKEIAGALASGGASVVVAGRDLGVANEVAAAIGEEYGVEAVGFAGDLAAGGVAERIVEMTIERFGRVDILVNNAAINERGPIEEKTPEQFDHTMAVNVKAPWLLCRAVARHFKARGYGRVINIAGSLGLVGMADRTLYCTSKGAIIQLTRTLAVEWAAHNVTVNVVCPGPLETEMNSIVMQDPVQFERLANFTAMRRWGKLEEIGPSVLYLASDAASYVTGAVLSVDGGWVAKA